MRRFPVVIGATVAGLAGVLSFHSRSGSGVLTNTLNVAAGSQSGSAHPAARSSGTTTTGPAGGSSGPAGGSSGPAGGSSAAAVVSTRQVTGPSENYYYGILSVRVTISHSRLANVQVVGLRTAESYSQQIADQVIPMLRQEALSAQSARINGISGATYTCEAYAMSLQAALSKAHFA